MTNKVRNALLESLGGEELRIPPDFPAEETITWWVYHHQEPVLTASRDHEQRFPAMMELFRRFSVESACILPALFARSCYFPPGTINNF